MQHINKAVFTTLLLIYSIFAHAQLVSAPTYMEETVPATIQLFSNTWLEKNRAECVQNGISRELSDSKTTGFKVLISRNGKIVFAVRFSCGGKNIYRRLGDYPALSIAQARACAQKLIVDIRTEYQLRGANMFAAHNMLVSDLVKLYEQDVLDTQTKRSDDGERSKIRLYVLPRLGHMKVSTIRESDIARYLFSLDTLKPATRNRHLALLKAIFKYAYRNKLVTALPTEFIKMLPETTSQRRAMSKDEFQKWLDVCVQQHNAQPDNAGISLLMFLGFTGLRLGETRHLRLEDVDWSRKVITLRQTKNGKLRYVPVCEKAFVLLTEQHQHLGDKGWVFPGTKADSPVSEPRRLHKSLCSKAGISSFTIHELRHSFATFLAESGADIHMVKDMLGHSTIRVTEIYLHASTARHHDAVNKAMNTFES